LTDENVDATIAEVKALFRRENKLFGWLVTPNSTPPNLGDRLAAAGFSRGIELAGMTLTDLSTPMRANPEIRVRRAGEDEVDGAVAMMVRAYGMPGEARPLLGAFFRAMNEQLDFWLYFAYVEGEEEPVAFGMTFFLPGVPIIVLQGAGTLPEHRGQGIYSTLVAHRLADARERGIQAAVIQAVRETSAPIAAKLGFEEVCTMWIYIWDPATSS
jgi:GNAT superfamily N-acetyltransferase